MEGVESYPKKWECVRLKGQLSVKSYYEVTNGS